MRYIDHCCFCSRFHLTMLSLSVNISAPESQFPSDSFDSTAHVAPASQPASMPWSLEHFLDSVDSIEALFVGASPTATSIASSPIPGHSTMNTSWPQNGKGSWSLEQFVTHSERIETICMGLHDHGAAKVHQRTLLADMECILACLEPQTPL